MAKTGERYATARRHILGDVPVGDAKTRRAAHLTGNVPATTALRALLTAAGTRAPHTNEPFTEAMLFGIAGGIGIGIYSFVYEKENFASFYVAGRHDWASDLGYLTRAAQRLGGEAIIAEGAKLSAQAIANTFAAGQPCIIWVDAAGLSYKRCPRYTAAWRRTSWCSMASTT